MAVAVGLVPVTGQTLPLVSMGGSSIFFTSMATGMILSVSWGTKEDASEKEKEASEKGKEASEKGKDESGKFNGQSEVENEVEHKQKKNRRADIKKDDQQTDDRKVEFELNE